MVAVLSNLIPLELSVKPLMEYVPEEKLSHQVLLQYTSQPHHATGPLQLKNGVQTPSVVALHFQLILTVYLFKLVLSFVTRPLIAVTSVQIAAIACYTHPWMLALNQQVNPVSLPTTSTIKPSTIPQELVSMMLLMNSQHSHLIGVQGLMTLTVPNLQQATDYTFMV
jgi:hypothetical protein